MKLNCDLAELTNGVEGLVMPYIDMANICCAAHAGSVALIQSTLIQAKRYGVEIGAHPSYPDRQNFGRKTLNISADELSESLYQQILLVSQLAKNNGQILSYVKPHGALYNDMMQSDALFKRVLKAITRINVSLNFKPNVSNHLKLMLLANPNASHFQHLATPFAIELIFEAFADRRYTDEGYLTARTINGAVLNKAQTLMQVQQLLSTGHVETSTGQLLPLNAQTLCVHGDNKDSIALIKKLKRLCHL